VGQPITELDRATLGDVAIYTLDRNLTSMGMRAFDTAPDDPDEDDFAAILSSRIFESDVAVNRVYVAANVVQVTRRRGWDAASLESVGSIITDLFLFYG
jgi:hypothetical protein